MEYDLAAGTKKLGSLIPNFEVPNPFFDLALSSM